MKCESELLTCGMSILRILRILPMGSATHGQDAHATHATGFLSVFICVNLWRFVFDAAKRPAASMAHLPAFQVRAMKRASAPDRTEIARRRFRALASGDFSAAK
jgi:hypothetical protein